MNQQQMPDIFIRLKECCQSKPGHDAMSSTWEQAGFVPVLPCPEL
jgi:hypothetical protein